MKIGLALFLVTAIWITPRCKSQSAAALVAALDTMSLRDKVIFLADILMKNEPLFKQLEKILLSAFPLIENLELNPPLNQVLLPWILDEIPVIIQNEIFVNVTQVVVKDLNKINTTNLNMTSYEAFMNDYIQLLDFYEIVKDIAVVVCRPIFIERGLKEELYPATVAWALESLEEFLRLYGERVIHKVIDVLNDILDSSDLLVPGDLHYISTPALSPSLISTRHSATSTHNIPTSKIYSATLGHVSTSEGLSETTFTHISSNMTRTKLTTTFNSNHHATFTKHVPTSGTFPSSTIRPAANATITSQIGMNTNISTTITRIDNNRHTATTPSMTPATGHMKRRRRHIQPTNKTSTADFGTAFRSRVSLVHLAKEVLLNMSDVIVPYAMKLGMKKELVKPILVEVLNDGENFLEKSVPKMLVTFINDINNASMSGRNITNPLDYLVSASIQNIPSIIANILKSKGARDFFPVTSTDTTLSDICYNDVMDYIDALIHGSKWAIKMFDATGKPPTGTLTGNLHMIGSYDQCLAVQYESQIQGHGPMKSNSGKYCRTTFTATDGVLKLIHGLIGTVDTHGVPITITIGLCLPKSCRQGDVRSLVRLGPLREYGLAPSSVECSEPFLLEDDTDSIVFMCIMGVLVLVVILSTVIHVIWFNHNEQPVLVKRYVTHQNRAYDEDAQPHSVMNGHAGQQNGHVTSLGEDETDNASCHSERSISVNYKTEEGIKEILAKCFSIYKNVPELLSTEHGDKDITCIHGIRVLSLAFIILGNSFLYTSLSITDAPVTANLLDGLEYLKLFTFQAVLAAPYAVDTFFLISGCLVSKCFLDRTTDSGKLEITKSFLGFYIHKYIRITPVYVVVLVGYSRLYHYVADGPMYPQAIAVADKCQADWWKHIVYVNNVVGTQGNGVFDQCMPWSWFLACLMQFYLITPFIMVFFLMSKKLGAFVVTLSIMAGVASSIVKEGQYGGDIMSTASDGGAYWNNVFIVPWCRISAYSVGILLGFILYKKSTIPKNKIIKCVGWFVSIALFVSITYSPYSHNKDGGVEWTLGGMQAYEALSRPIWAVAVAWVVFACHYDMGGFVNQILSWNGFLPLSRLSYVTFLLHPIIMVLFVYSKRVLVFMNDLEMIYMFLGHLTLSYGGALILSAVFERPFLNVELAIKKLSYSWKRSGE